MFTEANFLVYACFFGIIFHVLYSINCAVINECKRYPSMCQNGGTCIDTPPGSYHCSCVIPWIGQNCSSFDACKLYTCSNNRTCSKVGLGSDKSYKCKCPISWIVPNCTETVFNMSTIESTEDPLPAKDCSKEVKDVAAGSASGGFALGVSITITITITIKWKLKFERRRVDPEPTQGRNSATKQTTGNPANNSYSQKQST